MARSEPPIVVAAYPLQVLEDLPGINDVRGRTWTVLTLCKAKNLDELPPLRMSGKNVDSAA